jgi:hypothetical protein
MKSRRVSLNVHFLNFRSSQIAPVQFLSYLTSKCTISTVPAAHPDPLGVEGHEDTASHAKQVICEFWRLLKDTNDVNYLWRGAYICNV